MEHAALVKSILRTYRTRYPNEDVSGFERLLESTQSIISRKNFFGHLTASAIVLNPTRTKVLLIQHKNLDKWIQPGGHIDETDSAFYEAARREATEETGYQSLMYIPIDEHFPLVPLDVDIHRIPANEKKSECAHSHFDLRYLFVLGGKKRGSIAEAEIGGYQFVPLTQVAQYEDDSVSRFAGKVLLHVRDNHA